jgi:hypothetical protein
MGMRCRRLIIGIWGKPGCYSIGIVHWITIFRLIPSTSPLTAELFQ